MPKKRTDLAAPPDHDALLALARADPSAAFRQVQQLRNTLHDPLFTVEETAIRTALEQSKWSVRAAASKLYGPTIAHTSLVRLLTSRHKALGAEVKAHTAATEERPNPRKR